MSPSLCGSPETNKNSKGVMFNHLNGRIQQQILSDIYNCFLKLFFLLLSPLAHICLHIQPIEAFLFNMMMIDTYLFWALDWLWSGPIFLSLRILGNYFEHIFTFLLMDQKQTVVVKKKFPTPISGFSTWNSCVRWDVGHSTGSLNL